MINLQIFCKSGLWPQNITSWSKDQQAW